MKLLAALLLLSSVAFAAETKTVKQNINETADQVDSGARKAIKEVKGLVKPKVNKK